MPESYQEIIILNKETKPSSKMSNEEEYLLNDGSKYTKPKNLKDIFESIAMKWYLTKLGNLMFNIIQKILWVIEKTVIWVSPCKPDNDIDYDHAPIRPLPWILFLPIIIYVRFIFMVYSFMTKIHLVKSVTTKDIVVRIQMYRWRMYDVAYRAKTYKTDLKQNKDINIDNNSSDNGIYDSIIKFLRILTFTDDIEILPDNIGSDSDLDSDSDSDSDSQYKKLLNTTYSSDDSNDITFDVNNFSESEETTGSDISMDEDEFKYIISIGNDEGKDAIDSDDAESIKSNGETFTAYKNLVEFVTKARNKDTTTTTTTDISEKNESSSKSCENGIEENYPKCFEQKQYEAEDEITSEGINFKNCNGNIPESSMNLKQLAAARSMSLKQLAATKSMNLKQLAANKLHEKN